MLTPMRIVTRSILLLLFVAAGPVHAGLDLRNASVDRLDNGLTVILLEDRNFPVASVQMLYRVGARDEVTGKTGLAHFLEHMAFRDSANFPDTGLVSEIYARGGEWHGYTWTDETTYFATVPKEQLDLLLRIEADRMQRLEIAADDMAAERGAVLAEMHMYENDPGSMLLDAVLYTAFLAHPYRNNTIGWQSDIEHLEHQDVVDFYQRHYHPANAVLVVVGDIEPDEVRTRIAALFAPFPKKAPTAMPHTIEPVQNGVRRVRLHGAAPHRQFRMAWRAPAANSPDFAAFLVVQSLLGASSGVNFNQNDWGADVAVGAMLDGVAENLTTWYPPSAQDYVFVVGGTAPAGVSEADVEQAVEKRIAALRRHAPDQDQLAVAVDDVLEQLIYDVETTEDAAHQLAFFAGLGALDTLLALPDQVAAVTAADAQRVAARYLLPERRSIAWYVPQQSVPTGVSVAAARSDVPPAKLSPKQPIDIVPAPLPETHSLRGGIPVILQRTDLSPSAYLQVVLACDRIAETQALTFRGQAQGIAKTIATARAAIDAACAESGIELSRDPATRLEQVFKKLMAGNGAPAANTAAPALLVISGDIDVVSTLKLLEKSFGKMAPAAKPAGKPVKFSAQHLTLNIGNPIAQAQLGYIVPAAAPTETAAVAQQLLLYIVSHGYEGRLGKAAISERGLAYYIDSQYRSNGNDGWLTLAIGVDVDKLEALQALLQTELNRLVAEPPTPAEVEEAKAYLVGRARSAAQSNEELASTLATQWLWYGNTQTLQQLELRLDAISRQDVLDAIPAFVNGSTIIVRQ